MYAHDLELTLTHVNSERDVQAISLTRKEALIEGQGNALLSAEAAL